MRILDVSLKFSESSRVRYLSLSVSWGKLVHLCTPGWCVTGHMVTQFVHTLVSLHCLWLQEQLPLDGNINASLRSLKFKEIGS